MSKIYGDWSGDNLSEDGYVDWCKAWIDEGIRMLKPGGAFFLYNLPKWNAVLAAHLSGKLNFRHWISIEMTFSLPIASRLYPSHYSLLYFIKGSKPKVFNPPRLPLQTCRHCGGELKDYGGYKSKMNPKGVNLSDVWTDIPPVRHKKYKNRASNELNLKLMDRVLDIASNEGDVVFDPFGGSGTTFIAAELKKRSWVGIELATTEAIIDRFENLEKDHQNLMMIQEKKNKLFTKEALLLRVKHSHKNANYRLAI